MRQAPMPSLRAHFCGQPQFSSTPFGENYDLLLISERCDLILFGTHLAIVGNEAAGSDKRLYLAGCELHNEWIVDGRICCELVIPGNLSSGHVSRLMKTFV